MHRVAASYLRGLSRDAGAEFQLLAQQMQAALERGFEAPLLSFCEPHVLCLLKGLARWFASQERPGSDPTEAGRAFATWIATHHLDRSEWWDLHLFTGRIAMRLCST